MARVTSHIRQELGIGWQCTSLPPDAATDPRALAAAQAAWIPATVPGTVASALRDNGRDVFRDKPALDDRDHWYRCTFRAPERASGTRLELALHGLATFSEAWLNGERLLETDNMYVPSRVDVTDRVRAGQGDNELAIRFRALDRVLSQKRPRPRWRTRLTDHAQLRWIRTSLLGRMPGWSPPLHAVGPWRPVELVVKRDVEIEDAWLAAEVTDLAQPAGRVRIRLRVRATDPNHPPDWSRAELRTGDARAAIRCKASGAEAELEGELTLPDVRLWWPHTHGAQPLYPVRVELGADLAIELGSVGFRRIALDREDGRFQLRVNDVPMFCRGACWTTTDITALTGSPAAYARDLERARDAGMNMLRISGTLFYESDEFYRRCDELGILVWQDFMFANMDYPIADASFAASVDREVTAFLSRTQANPSVAVFCGGSEVEQQIAMLGLPRDQWRSPLFDEVLPSHVARLRADVPYCPNTPTGGDLPFDVNSGVSHYYGVGAYLRPLDDARRAELQFAAECLAFANVPDDATIAQVLRDGQAPVHHPAWKARVPRDVGASWDFEDVRDHYLQQLYRVEPNALRYSDPERYLGLSRVVSGEVMASALGEWRRARSGAQGALIWFYRDLWPGAGLGILDANGRTKAAYNFVQRALAPIAVWFSDEGLNGLHLHAANDTPSTLSAELRLTLHHDVKGTVLATATEHLQLPAGSRRELRVNALLPWFTDVTRAYRFGPPAHDLVSASLFVEGRAVADALYFPRGFPNERVADVGLRARAEQVGDGAWQLRVSNERLAYAVEIDVEGYEPASNFFHLPPGAERVIALRVTENAADRESGVYTAPPAGSVRPLNAHKTTKIALETTVAAERQGAT